MKKYMYRFSGSANAYGPFVADSMSHARSEIRRIWNLKRLPRGTEVWESDGKI